jgi:DNA-binding CsgD family transcriptional regulator/tetratricopeptide (TPR) repeat protein
VLDLLGHLVDKSLVQADVQDGAARYRLLETVREYALEAATTARETERARHRHAAHHLALAETADPRLRGREQVAWLRRLAVEHDNLRAALTWMQEQGEGEAALRLAGALAWFWHMHTHYTEAYQHLTRLLAWDTARRPTRARAKALFGAGIFAWQLTDAQTTRALFSESLSICEQIEDSHGLAYALGGLAMAAGMEGAVATWRARTSECLALLVEEGDTWGRGWFGVGPALASMREGDVAAAQAQLEECGALFEQVGDRWAAAIPQMYLAHMADRRRDDAAARALYEQVLAINREMGDRWRIAGTLGALGHVTTRLGDHERAGKLLAEGLTISREVGGPGHIAQFLAGVAGLAGARGQREQGARLFAAADALHQVESGGQTLPTSMGFADDIAALHAQLGTAAFMAASAAGQALSPEQAIAEALALAVTPTAPSAAVAHDDPTAFPGHLTARELDVLRLLAGGLSNPAIAARLVLSVKTVERHLANIYGKIDARGRVDAAAYALRHGLA